MRHEAPASFPEAPPAGEEPAPFALRLGRPRSFTICLALRPHYDPRSPSPENLLKRISGTVRSGLADVLFLSEPPPGSVGPAAATLAAWVLERGGEPVVSVSLAGAAREAVLAQVRALRSAGVRSLLAVTGDYPYAHRTAEPCFALDSLQALMLLRGGAARDAGVPPDLHPGCVVSPFKSLEAELSWQYARLRRKIGAGAGFVVAQAGYDPRAWDELARFIRGEGIATPLIGSVLVPDEALGRRIRDGDLPGVSITAELLGRLAGGGHEALRLAGTAVAVLRGLGYQGVLLGGRPLADGEIGAILEEAEQAFPRWRERLEVFGPPPPRHSYFLPDPATGQSTAVRGEVRPRARYPALYVFSYLVDYVAFGSWPPFFRLLTRLCRFCERGPLRRRALWLLEYVSKVPLYRCRMCGDCTLYACGFLCCESGCPKRAANGPCGGSLDGKCEVEGVGACFWVKVYDRLKATAERPDFPAAPIPPKDRRLEGGCSWINYCLGRDHRRLGAAIPAEGLPGTGSTVAPG